METKIVKSTAGEYAIKTKRWWRPWYAFYQELVCAECFSVIIFKTFDEAKEYEKKILEDRVYITWSDA
jgi:hypothetical protein